jgi:hypothetical protein
VGDGRPLDDIFRNCKEQRGWGADSNAEAIRSLRGSQLQEISNGVHASFFQLTVLFT